MGQWSSGYDVALTTRRSHVRFLPGPFSLSPKLLLIPQLLQQLQLPLDKAVTPDNTILTKNPLFFSFHDILTQKL